MLHKEKNKKGYISIEYAIVTGIVIAAVFLIFVSQMPGFANQINLKLKGGIDIISGDETITNN